jgi:hypothetical protein
LSIAFLFDESAVLHRPVGWAAQRSAALDWLAAVVSTGDIIRLITACNRGLAT